MNSKQRKIANKIRERAELDGSANLQKLASERSQFEQVKAGWQAQLSQLSDQLAKDRADLTKQVEMFREGVIKQKAQFVIDKGLIEEANVLREIILELELDAEPSEIALSLRKKFGLLIPEW